jgi:hypothetical protein
VTFAALLTDVYRRCNYANPPSSSEVIARIKAFVNETQQELAAEQGLTSLMRANFTFASVASQQTYGLPAPLARILAMRELTTKRKLWARSLDWYRTVAPDPSTTSGTPAYYVMMGPQAVAKQPSAAAELFVKSTAVGDTTQTCYVEGLITGGYPRTASVVLTGTTAVTLSSLITDWIEVTDVYLSAVGAGVITLHQTSGAGTELARFAIGQTQPTRYEGLALYPTPSAAITYLIDGEIDVTDLVNDTDSPDWLPVRFHRLLSTGTRVKEYEKTSNDLLDSALAQFEREKRALLAYVNNPPDGGVILPIAEGVGITDLVGQYPAGTIWDGF